MDSGEVNVVGCGRSIVHDGLLDVVWFCVCKLGGFVDGGNECKLVGESACALGDRRVCVEVV
jgi:hypothetical protein